jgi:anti-sigma B factor antagonist
VWYTDGVDLLRISVPARESSGAPYTLVELAGEADATNLQQLREALEAEVAARPRTLIIDLSGLNFMDSSVLRVLLHASRTLDREGGVIGLAGARGPVARVLRFTRADQLVPLYDSVQQAAAG